MARSITAERSAWLTMCEALMKMDMQLVFEMQQVLPDQDLDDLEYDPVIEANDLREVEQLEEARIASRRVARNRFTLPGCACTSGKYVF